jgi:Mn2+/Fe2+ NRAMP family transporter
VIESEIKKLAFLYFENLANEFVANSFLFLFLENYGVRKLEAVFAVLIATMGLSFAWMFGETKPSGKELMIGKDFRFLLLNFTLFALI